LLFLGRDQSAKMTAAEVTAAASRYFKRDNRTVGLFLPDDQPQRAEVPAAPTLTAALKDYVPQKGLAEGEKFDPSQVNIDSRTQHTTIVGLKVALLPKKTLGETVNVAMDFQWGDEKTLFGKQTAAAFASAMLARGTVALNREQLADASDKLNISGTPSQFQTTRDNLPAALNLIASIYKEPRFDAVEFEQLRKEALVGLEASRNEPSRLAREAIAQHYNQYPPGHWLAAQTLDEQIASYKAVTLEEVKAFYKEFYSASHGELAVVGDFDVAETTKAIQANFGDWKNTVPYARVIQKNFDVAPLQKTINTPDKENGNYVARQNLDMRDDDADYPALVVGDYLFGGGSLKSRLADRVRQKEGLSYSIGSSLNVGSISRAATFSIGAIAAPQNLSKVDVAVKDELAKVLKDGFTAEELARAKSGILQELHQTRSQDAALSAGWIQLLDLDRTFVWSKQMEDKISALTLDQVNAAFRKWINPAKLSVVIARDETKVNQPNNTVTEKK
ncbi:MAG: insulinase family protein, partial [Glaciimonas sp.]|nr:insulinase family protein [Glaciimonas sp.]